MNPSLASVKKPPVVIFVYNRPDSAQSLFENIRNLKSYTDRNYYIFSDGGKDAEDWRKVLSVRSTIKSFPDLKAEVFESECNLGLANSVISGVTRVLEKHDSAIVLEDDLALSDDFFLFMDFGLDGFRKHKEVLAVCGYTWRLSFSKEPLNTSYRFSSWGWAIWADRWSSIDWDMSNITPKKLRREANKAGSDIYGMIKAQKRDKIDSWAVRLVLHQVRNDLVSVHPRISRAINLGLNNSGTHSKYSLRYKTQLRTNSTDYFEIPSNLRPKIINQISLRLLHSWLFRLMDYFYNILKSIY